MKKNLLYLLMLACSMSLFTACSDDENNGEKVEILPVEDLAGVYKGALSVTAVGDPVTASQNITLAKSGDNAIKMELKSLKFSTFNIGDIVIDNCAVTKEDDKYYFTGQQVLDLTDKGLGKCPVKIVKGEVNGDKVTLSLTVDTTVPISLIVRVGFDGTKLKGHESSEAKISDFTIDSEVVTEQPAIDEATGSIIFKVNEAATTEELKLTPVFTISEKATVSPASDIVQDFSNGNKVTYTVIAEDGTVKEYKVYIAGMQNVLKYSFEDWDSTDSYDKPQPVDQLATSSEGAAFIASLIGGNPVFKTDDKKEGTHAITLVTRSYPEPNMLIPAIISGSVFTGKFDQDFLDWATGEKLSCARFGLSYDRKPLRFKGWYKYAPGAKFVDSSDSNNVVEVPDKTDECAIQAILFKVDKDDEVLTGHNVNNSNKRVAVAQLADGTAKAEYTEFDIPFTFLEGKSYEAGAKYKMAIVCSSSKEGDYFKGAENSTLILDELEVIGE